MSKFSVLMSIAIILTIMSQKNKSKIEQKLDQLNKLLDNLEDARLINSDDPETWDSDTLYDLLAHCKEIIQLLEDKEDKKQRDEFGEPLILEKGLCSLVDDWTSEEEDF